MPRNKTLVLLDADVLVYRSAFGVEQNVDWGEGQHSWHARMEDVIPVVNLEIQRIKDTLKADKVVMALTCSDTPNFRKAIYPEYKMNRASTRKPLLWKQTREYIIKTFDTRIKANLEADDVLGIMQTMPMPGWNTIIASIDKDFMSIPGKFYNLGKSQMFDISEEEADYAFYKQVLTGDKTDNYPGIPGVGPVKAEKILDAEGDLHGMWWPAVKLAYHNAGLDEDVLMSQVWCARILRFTDYDTKAKQPILWRGPDER